MKKAICFSVLAGCFFMMVAIGSAQEVEPARFSDYFAGQFSAGIASEPIDTGAGICLSEGLGVNTSLSIIAKRNLFEILPAGIYLTVGYRTESEGSKDPLAQVLKFGAGWMNDPNADVRVVVGANKVDLRDFFNPHDGSGDAFQFHWELGKDLFVSGIHTLTAILKGSGTIPIIKDEKDLRGFNTSIAVQDIIRGDERDVALGLLLGMGLDDGSFRRRPAGLVFSEVYGLFNFPHDITVKFPYVRGVYVNGNNTGGGIERKKEMASVGFVISYKF